MYNKFDSNIINKNDPTSWSEMSYLKSSCSYNYIWKDIIEDTFKHIPYYIELKDNSDITQAVAPIFHIKSFLFGSSLTSMPYLNSGGIIYKSKEALMALSDNIRKLGKELNVDYVELRCNEKIKEYDKSFICKEHKSTFHLELEDSEDKQLSKFSSKLRSQIKRALKENLSSEIILGSNYRDSDLNDFYKVFSRHMRDLGTPVYPKKFFKNVLDSFKDKAVLTIIKVNGKLSSASITIINNDSAEIIWASSLRKYNKYSVNMYMYWKIIKYLISLEITTFDFGRTTKNSGGYKFKKQWGAKEIPLYWYYFLIKGEKLPNASPENKGFSLPIAIWRRLPLPIANFIGPILTKHLP